MNKMFLSKKLDMNMTNLEGTEKMNNFDKEETKKDKWKTSLRRKMGAKKLSKQIIS